MNLQLNYISFVVADMQRSLDFYRSLGLPIPAGAHLTEAGELEDHVELMQGGLRIAWESETLIRSLNPAWTPPPAGQSRLSVAFGVESPADIDAVCGRMKAAGFPVLAEPYDAPWGQRYATVQDPGGTSVDLFAWLPAQP
jgi:catechol 2,3-dioxygenase-like lactoylglutathione lyase family enzyme